MTCARNQIHVYKSNFPKAIEAMFCCRLFVGMFFFFIEVIVGEFCDPRFKPLKLSSTSFTTHTQFSVSQSFMRPFSVVVAVLFLFTYAEKCRRIFNYIAIYFSRHCCQLYVVFWLLFLLRWLHCSQFSIHLELFHIICYALLAWLTFYFSMHTSRHS